MLLFVVVTLTITNVISNYIYCNNDKIHCGPCNTSEQCHLNCIGYETCKGKDQQLICKDNHNCEIVCDGEIDGKSCLDATIYSENVINTTINCKSYEDCKNAKLYASDTDSVVVNCMQNNDNNLSENNCQDMIIDARLSTSLEVNCNGYHSCKQMQISCGINCTINCNENQGHVCDGLNLTCGTGSCQINCNGYNKCPGVVINTEQVTRFACIGSENDCMFAPASFVIKKTAYTTSNPTATISNLHTSDSTSTNLIITKPIFGTNITTTDKQITKLGPTLIIIEQTANIQSEKAELFDLSEVPTYVYLITGAMLGMSTTICAAVLVVFVYERKKRTRRRMAKYSDINYQKRMESIVQMDEYEPGHDNRHKNSNTKYKVANVLHDANCNEGVDDHSELDFIDNVMINRDDEVVQHVDNMTITGGVNVDLDMRINDYKSNSKTQ